MRKMILISAFVPASVSAEAGQSRGLVLAANDEAKTVQTATPPQAPVAAAKPDAARPDAAKSEAANTQTSSSSKKTHARRHESDEAKARR
jgi:hypothetical protein